MYDDELCPADWRFLFDPSCDLVAALGLLNAALICNWDWKYFLWKLPLLRQLLVEQPATYDYLYVTRFLKARAAYLVMQGPFASNPMRVLDGIVKRRIQFGCIYRYLFLFALEQALRQRERSPTRAAAEDRLFQVNVSMAETAFLEIVEVTSLSANPDLVVHGYRVGDWAAGVLHVKGQPLVELATRAVDVRVDIEDAGWYRKVKPVESVLMGKIIERDRIRCFRERQCNGTPCDVEMERLCNRQKVSGFPVICCSDESIQYYRTTANPERNTLYVVCADRTLRIRQAGLSQPGSVPQRIYVPGNGKADGAEYLVEFDNGVLDAFVLSFRAHYENERRDYLASINGAACAWPSAERLAEGVSVAPALNEAKPDRLKLGLDRGTAEHGVPAPQGQAVPAARRAAAKPAKTTGAAPRTAAKGGADSTVGARGDAGRGVYELGVRGRKSIQLNRAAYVIPTWRCCVKDRSFDLPEVVGTALLVRLLKAPGRTFYADELLRLLTGEAADAAKAESLDWLSGGEDAGGEPVAAGSVRWQVADRQEVWDSATIQGEVNRIRVLRTEIADCGSDPGDAGERGALEQELEARLDALLANSRPGPGGYPLPITFNGDLKKAANLVGKHFRGLLSRLKSVDETLWRHFSDREILLFGQTCRYDEAKGFEWRIT